MTDTSATVSLDSLVGMHELTGCDLSVEKVETYCGSENANVIRFTLDGVTYTAVEDPDDGYRSSMDRIFAEDVVLQNTFAAVRVETRKKAADEYGDKNDTLELVDVQTGKVVLEVGTDNVEDYYPYFVGTFSPQNMASNAVP